MADIETGSGGTPIYTELPGYHRMDGSITPFPEITPNPNEAERPLTAPEVPTTEELVARIGQASLLPGYKAVPEAPRLDTPLDNWPRQNIAA